MELSQPSLHLPSSRLVGLDDLNAGTPADRPLAVIRYTTESAGPALVDGTVELSLHMADSADSAFAEVWTVGRPVESGERDGIVYSHDGEYLVCAGRIPPQDRYSEATRAAYVTALDLMDTLGFKNSFRMWNFVSRINEDNADGLEVYQDFCLGRAEAFEQFRFGDRALPAATGIGSLGGGIAFYFLACRSGAPTGVENSKQVSAYHYPRQYGPRPPKFARATYLSATHTDRTSGQLYVSGTASIRGHETLFTDDIERQCRLALDNIAHVIGPENLSAYELEQTNSLRDLRNIKVYVRHAEHIPVVRDMCREAFSPDADIACLNVDVCRSDLLVEIEGIVSPCAGAGS